MAAASFLFGHQIKQHAWIDLPRPRAHRQPIKRGKAHRAFDALSVGQSAHRSAAAKVRDDDASVCDTRCDFAQPAGDVFVRKSVKSISPDTLAIEMLRYRVVVGDRAVTAMECGVEAGDLQQIRAARQQETGSAPDCSADAAVRAAALALSAARTFASTTIGRS